MRTATEQLLISTAADRAAEKLAEQVPPNIKAYLETAEVATPDASYAEFVIKDRLLRRGVLLVADPQEQGGVVIVQTPAAHLVADAGAQVGAVEDAG